MLRKMKKTIGCLLAFLLCLFPGRMQAQVGPWNGLAKGAMVKSNVTNVGYIFPADAKTSNKGFEIMADDYTLLPPIEIGSRSGVCMGDVHGTGSPYLNMKQSSYIYGSIDVSMQNLNFHADRQITFQPGGVYSNRLMLESNYASAGAPLIINKDNFNDGNLTIGNCEDGGAKIFSESNHWLRISSSKGVAIWGSMSGVEGTSPTLLVDSIQVNVGSAEMTTPLARENQLLVKKGILSEDFGVVPDSYWPDYVFDEGYPLITLEDLKKEIMANRHLPDVPDEESVRNGGYDLNEMTETLLKKIEELYLYVIQNQKKIDDLKARLAAAEDR